jgi:hypothetical protein
MENLVDFIFKIIWEKVKFFAYQLFFLMKGKTVKKMIWQIIIVMQ